MTGATLLEFVIGILCIGLGVLWIAFPTRMMRYQVKLMYVGKIEAADEHGDRERTIGRVGGAILAVAGAALAAGLTP